MVVGEKNIHGNYKFVDMKNLTRILILISLLCAIILGITIYFTYSYYASIFNGELSIKSEDWGNFGDYLSGTIGNAVAFINLIVTGFIAYIVMIINKNHTYEMNLLNLKFQRYSHISIKLNELLSRLYEYKIPKDNNLINRDISQFVDTVGIFEETDLFLWEDTQNEIKTKLNELTVILGKDINKESFNSHIKNIDDISSQLFILLQKEVKRND